MAADHEHAASRPLAWRGFRGWVKDNFDPAPILDLFRDDHEVLVPGTPAHWVKDKLDKGSRVFRAVLSSPGGEEEFFLKTIDASLALRAMRERMKDPGRPFHHYPVKMIKLAWAPSAGKRCLQTEAACIQAGIPVAEHLFRLSRGRGWLRREIIAVRGVAPRPADNARTFFESGAAGGDQKARLVRQLGGLLGKVRASGIMFPDFKLHNLVLRQAGDGGYEFVVVDLAEAAPGKWDYKEADFLRRFGARLPGFSEADKETLARAYLEAGNDPRPWTQIRGLLDADPDRITD